jgi:hypothetical protein
MWDLPETHCFLPTLIEHPTSRRIVFPSLNLAEPRAAGPLKVKSPTPGAGKFLSVPAYFQYIFMVFGE